MNLLGLAVAAAGEVSAHRLRVALSILSLVIGTASVTAVTALGEIGQAAARVQVERETGRAATMELTADPLPAAELSSLGNRLEARLGDRGWTDFSPAVSITGSVADPAGFGASGRAAGADTAPLTLVGVASDLAAIRRLRIVEGRWLSPTDGRSFAPVIVVNRVLARDLDESPGATRVVGRELSVVLGQPVNVRVVGVVDDGDREARAYAPWDGVVAWLPVGTMGPSWLVRVPPADVPDVSQLAEHLGGQWSVDGMLVRRLDSFEDFAPLLGTIQLVLSLVAAVALVTGGLGILNLGLVTVRQRAREFGLRRAFGAPQRDIVVLVLLESALTGFVAGVLGVLLVALLQLLLPLVVAGLLDPADIPPFPLDVAVAGLGLATGVGLLAGLLPALRARDAAIIGTIRN